MSAIWGYISFQNDIAEQIDSLMRKPYETKCRIDRIQVCQRAKMYMACGIQYVTRQAEREILPFYNEERGCCFTADCLLDNREQLRKELNCQDMTIPDGQLMYQAYLKWGMKCLEHFRGLFSMAVYEEHEKTLYLAVDQVASRCLYYFREEKGIAFSTLIDPIREYYPEIGMNILYMKDFLTAPGMMPNIVSEETPYEGIFKLNPGTYLKLTQDEIREISYWNPQNACAYKCRNAQEYGRRFRELYEECVHDALGAQGEIGIAMSSGFDSASVGALAADMLDTQKKRLYAYTYVPSENGVVDSNRNNVLDERQDVMKIVEMHPNIKPHFLSNDGKNCYEDLDKCMEIMEIPFKACVNLPNLCEIYELASKEGCRVVLWGQAGNSTVSHGYIDDILYDLYTRRKYIRFLSYLNRYSRTVKESRKAALRGCLRYFHYADGIRKKKRLDYQSGNPFMSERILEGYPLEERYRCGEIACLESIPVERTMYQSFLYKKAVYTYLGELETKLGLAFNLVLRDPTKDIRMLQFCYHLPYHLFAYKGTPRWLIRENLKDILPASLLNDWMRYGVQNSDWFLRIRRDWKTVYPKLCDDLKVPEISQYLEEQDAKEFLENISKEKADTAEQELQYLLFFCVAGRFVEYKF